MGDGKMFNSHQERLEKYLVNVLYETLCAAIPEDTEKWEEFRILMQQFQKITTERYQTLFENSATSIQTKATLQITERDMKLTTTDTKTKEDKVAERFAQLLPHSYDFNTVPVDTICSPGFAYTISTAIDDIEAKLYELQELESHQSSNKSVKSRKNRKAVASSK